MHLTGRTFIIKSLLLLTACCIFLSSCAEQPPKPAWSVSSVKFADLPGWENDKISDVVPVLLRSCKAIEKKAPDAPMGGMGLNAGVWQDMCDRLKQVPLGDEVTAHAFFEKNFIAYAVSGPDGDQGLFTGYYEPELHGSLQREGAYQTPLYAQPDDLIQVDLGEFKSDLKGQHIVGKVEGKSFKPYDDRAAIARNALEKRANILAFVDDPVDAFFLAVQGSGRIILTNGSVLRIGYDGANGRAYVAIGRAMADRNLIEQPVTMQKIRDWLKANPERSDEIMNLNPSYVFFRKIDGDGPIGAETVALTPQRSLAVDPAFVPLGAPLWLDTVDADNKPLQRLVVAQDTGGAIKGAVRGDFFWGSGDEAVRQAGAMQSKGRYYILLALPLGPHHGNGPRLY